MAPAAAAAGPPRPRPTRLVMPSDDEGAGHRAAAATSAGAVSPCAWVALPDAAAPVRYTPHHVQAILQFMGCKTLHAVRLAGTKRRKAQERAVEAPLPPGADVLLG